MSDPFLVIYDFDILSMIERKNPLVFIVAFHFSNNNFDFQSLSRLICQMHFWFPKFDAFDFQNMTRSIYKVCRVWFLKWHFWFPKFIAFDFSNNTFDFQNLSRLISQMTLSISKICRVWFLKWRFDFQNETDMDDIHVTVMWVVSLTHGKARGTLSHLLHHDRTS